MKPYKIINFSEVSRLLCGSRHTLRENKVPKIHSEAVTELTTFVNNWIERQTAEQEKQYIAENGRDIDEVFKNEL